MRDEYLVKMQGSVERRRSIDKGVFLNIENTYAAWCYQKDGRTQTTTGCGCSGKE